VTVKVKVTDGYQLVDIDGKVHTSGTIEVDDAEARQAIAAGWVEKALRPRRRLRLRSNKKQPESSNK
jgi:hypothetical protein